MEDKKTLLIGGAIALIVVIVLVFRRVGGGSPTVITAGSNSDLSPTQERVALAGINADTFKSLLGYQISSEQNRSGENISLSQISGARDVNLGEQSTSLLLAKENNAIDLAKANIAQTLGLSQISAGRDVGLAQANAQSLAAQNQNAQALSNLQTLANLQAAQNRANTTQAALSQLGNLLRALTAGSGKSSGGASGSNTSANTSTARPVRNIPRRTGIPRIDLLLDSILPPPIEDYYTPAADYGSFGDFGTPIIDFPFNDNLLTPFTGQPDIREVSDAELSADEILSNWYDPTFDPDYVSGSDAGQYPTYSESGG